MIDLVHSSAVIDRLSAPQKLGTCLNRGDLATRRSAAFLISYHSTMMADSNVENPLRTYDGAGKGVNQGHEGEGGSTHRNAIKRKR